MKYSITNLSRLGGTFLMGCLLAWSCNKPDPEDPNPTPTPEVEEPSFSVDVATDVTSVTLTCETKLISEFSYLTYATEEIPSETPDASVITATGTKVEVVDGTNTITIENLNPNTDYTVFISAVAQITDENGNVQSDYYVFDETSSEVISVPFTTDNFTDLIAIYNVTYDGFTAYMAAPQETIERGNVVRYTFTSLAMYNMNRGVEYGFITPDADPLIYNNGMYFQTDTTVTWNNDNVIATDEYGEYMYHFPIAPGEPIVMLVGEYEYEDNGWTAGYTLPLFDYEGFYADSDPGANEKNYWSGYYDKVQFFSKAPEALDATIEISSEMSATDGIIRINTSDNVYQYCYLITDKSGYESILAYLDHNEDYLQWFVTSYFATMSIGAQYASEPIEITLKDFFYSVSAESDYHVLVTAMGDETGSTQCFKHEVFKTEAKSMPAPEIVVTHISNPYGEDSPYEIWFNVKAPNGDVSYAYYACNYVREWEASYYDGYFTDADVISMGYEFSPEDIALINSSEGLDVSIASRPDAVTRFGVLGYNIEDTQNDVNSENTTAIAEGRTPAMPDAARVESTLFDDLLGEWTASAYISSYDYYAGENVISETPNTCKVTITAGVEYPETLSDDVYSIYEQFVGYNREQTDNLYAEFKSEADEYNAKVRGQNCLLCEGFDLLGGVSLPFSTPFELFCDPEYNGYDNESIFYDFGPKWYLQISEGDQVAVPINANTMYPMDNINYYNPLYLVGYNQSGSIIGGADFANEYFDVIVSDDKNTITINPIVRDGMQCYPTPVVLYSSGYVMTTGYVLASPITLTRGWSGDSTMTTATKSAQSNGMQIRTPFADDFVFTPKAAPKKRTSMKNKAPLYKAVEYEVVTKESIERNTERFRTGK